MVNHPTGKGQRNARPDTLNTQPPSPPLSSSLKQEDFRGSESVLSFGEPVEEEVRRGSLKLAEPGLEDC